MSAEDISSEDLLEHLPQTSEAQSALTRAWYLGGSQDSGTTDQVIPDADAVFSFARVRLHAAIQGQQITLYLDDTSVPPLLQSGLSPALRPALLLALAEAQLADILDALERLFNAQLELSAIDDTTFILDDAVFAVYRQADGTSVRIALAAPHDSAALALSTLLEASEQRFTDRPVRVPLKVRVEVPAGMLPAGRVQEICQGAFVTLGGPENSGKTNLRAELFVASPHSRAGQLVAKGVIASRSFHLEEVFPMQSNNSEVTDEHLNSISSPMRLQEIEVEVRCEVATLTMTVQELSALGSGMMLDLEAPVKGLVGTLRVNGAQVAKGEIVVIGDRVGLKISRVFREQS
jgi:type III secretion system YscQ/HrcQ family protein